MTLFDQIVSDYNAKLSRESKISAEKERMQEVKQEIRSELDEEISKEIDIVDDSLGTGDRVEVIPETEMKIIQKKREKLAKIRAREAKKAERVALKG